MDDGKGDGAKMRRGKEHLDVMRNEDAILFCLLSLAKYIVVGVIGKSGSDAAALQIAPLQYYAGLSRSNLIDKRKRLS